MKYLFTIWVYSDKLRHVQVVINYSVAQFCTSKDTLAHISGAPSIDAIDKL